VTAMTKRYSIVLLLAMAFALSAASLPAAQEKADYDTSKQIKLVDATVTAFALTNMHAQIDFDAKDEKGAVQHWSVEADNVNTDYRFTYGNDQGWDRLTFMPGDMITITFNPSKKGAKGVGLLLRADIDGNGNTIFRVKKDQK